MECALQVQGLMWGAMGNKQPPEFLGVPWEPHCPPGAWVRGPFRYGTRDAGEKSFSLEKGRGGAPQMKARVAAKCCCQLRETSGPRDVDLPGGWSPTVQLCGCLLPA